jgi:hypothetical protein
MGVSERRPPSRWQWFCATSLIRFDRSAKVYSTDPGARVLWAAGPAPWKVAAEADVEAPFQVGPKPPEGGG